MTGGARAWGLGQAVTAHSDRFALLNNIAGIAAASESSVFSAYDSYYGFEGLGTVAFGAVLPFHDQAAAGFSVQRFGDKIYHELAFGLGVAHRINRISLGLKADYRQIAVNAPSAALSKQALVVSLGGIVQLSSSVHLGAHLYNLTQSSFRGSDRENVPTIMKAGLSYTPATAVRLSADFVKDTDLPASLRAGLEDEVISDLFVRTGVALRPHTAHFGLGYSGGSFTVDYAASSHPQLGWSHHVTLAYGWKKIAAKKE